MNIRAEFYIGHGGEETPRRFWLENTKVEVTEVLEKWLTPNKRYFKILGDDHSIYTFCLHLETRSWELAGKQS